MSRQFSPAFLIATQLLLYIYLDIRHQILATKGDAVDGKRSNLPAKDFISFRLHRMQCGQIDSHIIFDNVCIPTNKYIVLFVYYILRLLFVIFCFDGRGI
jgi:hypothetical protein